MDSKAYTSILKTICYADIFDYPLKEEEVFHFICYPERSGGSRDSSASPHNDMRGTIKRANGVIVHKGAFMFLKGREKLVALRLEREKISKKKSLLAERIVSILKYIPTIRLVGVSGSVAMGNAKKDHDIDLFIIAQTETIWLTRLLSTIVVELFGSRRRPSDTNVTDKICLNMFMDENFLSTPKEKQNLYKAHEICQLRVLLDRENTYQKFLWANRWVARFLPNAMGMIKEGKKSSLSINRQSLIVLELIAKQLQFWYMRRHQTSEIVTDHYLAFHPKDYADDVLTAYRRKLSLYDSQI